MYEVLKLPEGVSVTPFNSPGELTFKPCCHFMHCENKTRSYMAFCDGSSSLGMSHEPLTYCRRVTYTGGLPVYLRDVNELSIKPRRHVGGIQFV